jgi:hypothetical protein
MKKYIAFTLIFLCLGTFSWAQGAKTALFDVVKSQQELEIMKQILGTTLSFVAQNIQTKQAEAKQVNTPFGTAGTRSTSGQVNTPFGAVVIRDTYRYANMNAFYLYGQGAVFVMPTSNLRFSSYGALAGGYSGAATRELMAAQGEIEAISREMAVQARSLGEGIAGGVSGGVVGGVLTPPPPPPPPQVAQPKQPTPPTAPAPPAKPGQVSQEELRKKVTEAQEKVKKVRADTEVSRAKFLESLVEIKAFLIEALANHGDSLTTVKPNEYITLVLMLDDFGDSLYMDATGGRTRQEVISVQKSWITDYKAGRLTLDAFKQKAIQYAQ